MPHLIASENLIFTAAPGTGSTALVHALDRTDGAERLPDAGDDSQKHRTVAELVAADVISRDHPHVVVSTVRNPFDYWPSEWLRTRTRWAAELADETSWVNTQPGMVDRIADAQRMEFTEWLPHVLGDHARSGRTLHLNDGHIREAHIVLRTEALQADLTDHFGSLIAVLATINTTPEREPFQSYYNSRCRSLVEAVFSPTLLRFGYSFRSS